MDSYNFLGAAYPQQTIPRLAVRAYARKFESDHNGVSTCCCQNCGTKLYEIPNDCQNLNLIALNRKTCSEAHGAISECQVAGINRCVAGNREKSPLKDKNLP